MDRQIIGQIVRNKDSRVIVTENEYRGDAYIDIRLFYIGLDGEPMPTKKGIMLLKSQVPQLMAILGKSEVFHV